VSELSSRRKRVALFLAALAGVGAIFFFANPPSSRFHDLGLLLMIAWLPILSNFIFLFAKKRAPLVTHPLGFNPKAQRYAHLTVEATFLMPPELTVGSDGRSEFLGLALLGTEAFTLRLWPEQSALSPWSIGAQLELSGQFLNPGVALSRFAIGTQAKLLVGQTSVVGSFKTLAVHENA
jgi:hypothetical protein